MNLAELLADLRAESSDVRHLVASAADWSRPTPAQGWTVAHQIGHLTWTDAMSSIAAGTVLEGVGQVDATRAWEQVVRAATKAPDTFVDDGAGEFAALPPAELLARWDSGREVLLERLGRVDPHARIPWFGPPMKSTSMATARLMETWAHGLDIAHALGVEVIATDRIRHICHLGYATRAFAYLGRKLDPPEDDVCLALIGPGGDTWIWGDPDAEQRITGTAWDFARVAVRRAHPDDTQLVATGAGARTWLTIVQAFAGPPGADPVATGAGR